jgi:hypothetical protein
MGVAKNGKLGSSLEVFLDNLKELLVEAKARRGFLPAHLTLLNFLLCV